MPDAAAPAAPAKPPGLFARLGFTGAKAIQSATDVPWGLTRSSALVGNGLAGVAQAGVSSFASAYMQLQPKGLAKAPVSLFTHLLDHNNELGNPVMGAFSLNSARAQGNFEKWFGFSSKLDAVGTKIGTKLAAKWVTQSGGDPTDPALMSKLLHRGNQNNIPVNFFKPAAGPGGGDPSGGAPAPSGGDGGQGGTPSSGDPSGSGDPGAGQGGPPPASAGDGSGGAPPSGGDPSAGAPPSGGDPSGGAPAPGGGDPSGGAPAPSGGDPSGGAPAPSGGAPPAGGSGAPAPSSGSGAAPEETEP